tara:strand:- start:4906 stop:7278 length:2373 start_codon:yes stop_codon:yes gene_type:complete
MPFCLVSNASACAADGVRVHALAPGVYYSFEVCDAPDLQVELECPCVSATGEAALGRYDSTGLLNLSSPLTMDGPAAHAHCANAFAETQMYTLPQLRASPAAYEFHHSGLALLPEAAHPACWVPRSCSLPGVALSPHLVDGTARAKLSYANCRTGMQTRPLPWLATTLTINATTAPLGAHGFDARNWRCLVGARTDTPRLALAGVAHADACAYACALRRGCAEAQYDARDGACLLYGVTTVAAAADTPCTNNNDAPFRLAKRARVAPVTIYGPLYRTYTTVSRWITETFDLSAATQDPSGLPGTRPAWGAVQPAQLLQHLLILDRQEIVERASDFMDDAAMLILTLCVSLDAKDQFHVRRAIPTAHHVRAPRFRECARREVETDEASAYEPLDDDCPDIDAIWTAQGAADPRVAYGYATNESGAESTVLWTAVHCKENSDRLNFAYNYTHFVMSGSHMWGEGDFSVGARSLVDGELCTHPYLPGKVHCGYLRAALRWLVTVVDEGPTRHSDLCGVLLQGEACVVDRPYLVAGGESIGASIMIVFLMLFDETLARHYGLDLFQVSTPLVRVWFLSLTADDTFIEAFVARFDSQTRLYSGLGSIYFHMINSGPDNNQPDLHAEVFSTFARCGSGGEKRLYDCLDHCDPRRPLELGRGCAMFLLALGAVLDPDSSHQTDLLRIMKLDQDAYPREHYTKYKDSWPQRLTYGMVLGLDNALFDRGRSRSTMREAFLRYAAPNMCAARDDWETNVFNAYGEEVFGRAAAWCANHATLLASDPDALAEFQSWCDVVG